MYIQIFGVSLHMSVITQRGNSALIKAVTEGMTEVVSLLLEAGANTDLQNKVYMSVHTCKWFGRRYNLNRVVCEVT